MLVSVTILYTVTRYVQWREDMKYRAWSYLTGLSLGTLLLASCQVSKHPHSSQHTGTMQIVDAQHCANVSRQTTFFIGVKAWR